MPFEQRRKQGKTLKDGFKKLNSAISATVREIDFNGKSIWIRKKYIGSYHFVKDKL